MKTRIEKLEGKVADLGALCVMSLVFTGFAVVATYFFLMKSASAEWNAVQTALTVFEVFLVVALATGFWTVRRAAIDKADEAATEVAREIARECAEHEVREYVRLYVAPRLIRQIIEKSEDLGGGVDLTEQSVNDMMEKLS